MSKVSSSRKSLIKSWIGEDEKIFTIHQDNNIYCYVCDKMELCWEGETSSTPSEHSSVRSYHRHYLPSRRAATTKAMAATSLLGVTMHVPSAVTGLSINHSRSTPSPLSQNGGSITGTNGRIPDPLFVTVPPRTQRLLHSEAYIKYIEGLTPDNRNISNWEKQLKASEGAVDPPDSSRLPIHWLNNRNGNHGNILNALWTLRDFMFRDALGISKHF